MILRPLRLLSTLTVGIAAGLLVVSLPWPRVEFEVGGRTFETLHLEEAFTSLFAAMLIRLLLAERSVRALGAMRHQGRAWIYVLVGLNILLLPQTLGQGMAYLVEDVPRLFGPREDPWDLVPSAPGEVIDLCLEEVAPDERILLLGAGVRDFQGYLLAYYVHPRAVFMLPADENAMFFAYREGAEAADGAMSRVEEEDRPTREEYRAFVREHRIDWVLEIGDRYETAPGFPGVTRPPRGLEDWSVLFERGRRGNAVGVRLFRLVRSEEAFP